MSSFSSRAFACFLSIIFWPALVHAQSAVWLPNGATTGTIYYNGGNVAIGTTSTNSLLQVGPNSFGYGTAEGLLVSPSLTGVAYDRAVQISPLQTGAPAGNSVLLYVIPTISSGVTVPSLFGIMVDSRQGAGTSTSYAGEVINYSNNNLGAANHANILMGQLTIPTGHFSIYDATGSPSYFAGRIGIGTTTPDPTKMLDVNGDINVSGNINAKYQDVAEWVPASEPMTAGTVVVLNGLRSNEVMPATRAYDTAVAGVVSASPGVILGEPSSQKARIATTGRVRVKVDATTHPVAIGDLLVTSNKPGMAMVSEPIDAGGIRIHRPGTLIGKALEPLPAGEGEILVLLSLQ